MTRKFRYEIIAIPGEGYIRLTAEGEIDLEGMKHMYSSIRKSPYFRKGLNWLYDIKNLEIDKITVDDVKSFASEIALPEIDESNAAILMDKGLDPKSIEMLQILKEKILPQKIIITKSHYGALTWVKD